MLTYQQLGDLGAAPRENLCAKIASEAILVQNSHLNRCFTKGIIAKQERASASQVTFYVICRPHVLESTLTYPNNCEFEQCQL